MIVMGGRDMSAIGTFDETLAGVVRSILAGEPFTMAKGDFLDAAYAANPEDRPRMLRERPDTEDVRLYAYAAAMADQLAHEWGLTTPEWALEDRTFDHEPFFDYPEPRTDEMRLVLMVQSPPAFRSRKIFTTRNTLSRA